jgi:hypothetical protein
MLVFREAVTTDRSAAHRLHDHHITSSARDGGHRRKAAVGTRCHEPAEDSRTILTPAGWMINGRFSALQPKGTTPAVASFSSACLEAELGAPLAKTIPSGRNRL